jgi:hypothetical protein
MSHEQPYIYSLCDAKRIYIPHSLLILLSVVDMEGDSGEVDSRVSCAGAEVDLVNGSPF